MSFYKDLWLVNCFTHCWKTGKADGAIPDRVPGEKGVDGCMGVLLAFLIAVTKYLTKPT